MVRIVQHLCPQRHAVMALAYDSPGGEADPKVVEALKEMERVGGVNPWCGICGSRDLVYEDARTRFQTMEEARPAMTEAERHQMDTRALYNQLQRKAGSN